MLIKTLRVPFQRAATTNFTDASFTDAVVQLAKPSGAGVLTWDDKDGGAASNSLLLMPYGVGSDNNTFLMRIWGWRICGISLTTPIPIYVPTLLIELTCTLCAKVGVATGEVDNTNRLVDTLVQTSGYGSTPGVSNEVVSPVNNLPGHVVLDMKGYNMVQLTFNMNSSSTSANCLVSRF